MSSGQSLLLHNVLFLDTELDNSIINFNRITDFCITDIFGEIRLHTNTINDDTLNEIRSLVFGKIIVAFDSNQDSTFLQREMATLSVDSINIRWFCAKKFLESVLDVPNLSLKRTCGIVKLRYPKHNALSDCVALARIFRKVLKVMPDYYNEQYVNLILAILEACKEGGMDSLPLGDNLPLEYLIREIEGRTSLGTQYLELFRNQVLDELTKRGSFATNVEILKRTDDLNNVT